MGVSSLKFGFCPLPLHISGHDFSIEPLDGLDSIVKEIERSAAFRNVWVYRSLLPGSGVNPLPGRVFSLPKTHMLSIQGSSDEEKLRFVVWCLSFLIGMRLTTTEAGFLDATPIKPRLLVDFFTDVKSIARGLERALRFYDLCHNGNNTRLKAKRYEAAIHALFLAQNPGNLPFEEFSYLYMALDACYRMISESRNGTTSHAQRIQWTCARSGIDTPAWAKLRSNGSENGSPASVLRNAAIHEAIYMGEPLGFSAMDPATFSEGEPSNILLEMRALTCRILVFILGKQAGDSSRIDYVESPIDTRSTYGLDFP